MDPDRVTGSGFKQVVRLSGRKSRSAYSQRKADPLIFGAKMAPYLWRVDPSFRNSVTGSGSGAKCSNILQDRFYILLPWYLGIFNITFKYICSYQLEIVVIVNCCKKKLQ